MTRMKKIASSVDKAVEKMDYSQTARGKVKGPPWKTVVHFCHWLNAELSHDQHLYAYKYIQEN